jgi:hypothetical protein
MVYKSKKINKRRYLKRQSRKKMYGGNETQKVVDDVNNDIKSNVENNDIKSNNENNDIKSNNENNVVKSDVKSNIENNDVKSNIENNDVKSIEKNNNVVNDIENNDTTINNENKNENQGPTTLGNVTTEALDNVKTAAVIGLELGNIGFKSANGIAATGVEYVENGVKNVLETVGVDTNKSVGDEIQKIASTTGEITTALQSPAGRQAINNLKKIVEEVSEEIIAPGLAEVAEEFADKSGKIAEKAVNGALNTGSAVPVVGAALGVGRALNNVGQIVGDASALAAKVSGQTVDTVEKLEEKKGKLQDAVSGVVNLLNNANKFVSTGLKTVEQSIIPEQNVKQNVQSGGRLLKKIKKSSEIISDRIIQAQLEFLTPAAISSQMQQYYKNNYKTRRRRIKNNRLSRKR